LEFWKCGELEVYGVTLSTEDWRMKNLRGNEFGEMHTEAS